MHVPVEEVTPGKEQQVLAAMREHPVDGHEREEEHDEVEAVEDHWKYGRSRL